MNSRITRFAFLGVLVCVVGLLAWTLLLAPRHPVALLQVVDRAGKPIAGAIIHPEGLRTKPGPYVSGWYGWSAGRSGVPNEPVKTDAQGYARVAYPKYVFERIETGTLCLSVEHPDYVPDRPERMVVFAPPGGAPWRVWLDYAWGRIRHKVLLVRADPIVLQKGATLKLSAKPGFSAPGDPPLYAQLSSRISVSTNFWVRPGPGMLMTKSLPTGTQSIRAIQFESNSAVWFSPTLKLAAATGQISELVVELKQGTTVHGRLDDTVPRPVRNGRVIAQVYPEGEKAENEPPDWHAWSEIRPDGSFDIASLPEGQLELVALCDGFVSSNGPGQFPSMHYPQKFSLGTNAPSVTLGMEPTACLEVVVNDDQGKPLKGAAVSCWPNVRYGEWSATVIGQDCYSTADFLNIPGRPRPTPWWQNEGGSFQTTSDVSGLALIMNLPREAGEFTVSHPRFALPALDTGYGDKRRQVRMSLQSGHTNRATVRLEPAGQAPIGHY